MGIIEFLSQNIIGQVGDQVEALWLGNLIHNNSTHLYNYYSLSIFKVNPDNFYNFYFLNIYNFIYLSLSYLFGGILSYNLLLFIILVSNSICFYLLLKELNISRSVALVFSTFFSFIPYFYVHYEHQPLLILFPTLLIIKILLKNSFIKRNILILSVLFFVQLNISYYLGYFLAIYLFFWFTIKAYFYKDFKYVTTFFKISFFTAILFALFSFKFIASFLYPDTTVKHFDLPINTNSIAISTFNYSISRPIEDFLYFSSRPWYFFLYHSSHPLAGDITKNIINYFSNDLNLWLFKNYFPAEHNASFIGYTVLLIIVIGLYKKFYLKNKFIVILLIISLLLFIFSMPPFFFFNGNIVYTPSYLLYLFFPMFRSTARLSLFIHINLFIVASYFFNEIFKIINDKKKQYFLYLLIFFLVLDYSFKLKFTEVDFYVETSNFILENNISKNLITVYPPEIRGSFLINMHIHKSPLLNPPGAAYSEISFDSSKFTKNIDSCENLKFFEGLNGKYIIIKNYHKYNFKKISLLETVFESKKEDILIKSVSRVLEICK